ncbi:MAG: hypothetical protein P5702_16290 [Limnospira sp. PMC 1291.21]|uniref:Uncharacterized protein n=2 Tax=Limnospira TaxID=2596745 RepID=B5VU77_LIMMA|nr:MULTISPECIES: hypothetical protein [Limnospira]EKD10550.1 hypothetical protein SPLC1_S082250 [Arthrospira platensis C1]MDC0838528.1 hypothetical protein [Limnoraphis robusta]MDY7054750.1 hypothetical protein [Limnospira fusiformis LS22]QJB28341.1 hypothetical protein HFV01_24265 [Limnospira fusiformis SAG 85.79]EDZ97090.1 hypothetical protein AmaxDRAFT_0118 [Limnospira maxima CS-328]
MKTANNQPEPGGVSLPITRVANSPGLVFLARKNMQAIAILNAEYF